jgi:hypothetical protein
VAAVARGERRLRLLLQRRRAADRLDELRAELGGRERVEVRGVPVVPAEVELVDGLRVVAQRAVVAAVREHLRELRRQLDLLGDLARRVALVREP